MQTGYLYPVLVVHLFLILVVVTSRGAGWIPGVCTGQTGNQCRTPVWLSTEDDIPPMALNDNIWRETWVKDSRSEGEMTYGEPLESLAPLCRGTDWSSSPLVSEWMIIIIVCNADMKTCLYNQGATTGNLIQAPVDGKRACYNAHNCPYPKFIG